MCRGFQRALACQGAPESLILVCGLAWASLRLTAVHYGLARTDASRRHRLELRQDVSRAHFRASALWPTLTRSTLCSDEAR